MVRELIDVVVARLRIDLPAIFKQLARTVTDERGKQVSNLFAAGELFSQKRPVGLEPVR